MEGKEKFLRDRRTEFAPVLSPDTGTALNEGVPLTENQVEGSIEQIETKVLTWERPDADESAKRVLLEASEPAAYKTVKLLIDVLQRDERCRAITLVTDNVAGKDFLSEGKQLGLTQEKDMDKPVLADIDGPFDSVLVLSEPDNSPDKVLLYGGKSVFGDSSTKLVYLFDGVVGHNTREKFSADSSTNMDSIDVVGVPNEFTKQLLASAVPALASRIEVVGSLMLESFKESLVARHAYEPQEALEKRREIRDTLEIPEEATTVLYSGFPSISYASFTSLATEETSESGKTLNQETFERTLSALQAAARTRPEKKYALVIRTHPRASGVDNDLRVPDGLPENLTVLWANGPKVNYDDIAGAVDVIVCSSTSTEVLIAPYRGVVTAVSGYTEPGMQDEIDKSIFGPGFEAFKHSPDIHYIDSVGTLAEYLADFSGAPPRRTLPESPVSNIADLLLR